MKSCDNSEELNALHLKSVEYIRETLFNYVKREGESVVFIANKRLIEAYTGVDHDALVL